MPWSVPVKDHYRKNCRGKSKISRMGERTKNTVSDGALQRIELGDRSFVRICNDQNFGGSFGGVYGVLPSPKNRRFVASATRLQSSSPSLARSVLLLTQLLQPFWVGSKSAHRRTLPQAVSATAGVNNMFLFTVRFPPKHRGRVVQQASL